MASSRIEELPDDFDSSLNLNEAPADVPSLQDILAGKMPQDGPASSAGPSVKHNPAEPANMAEAIEQMKKNPIFMDHFDVQEADAEENPELEAMRALQYEGTRLEIAQGFKEQGNEYAKVKGWQDGREFYMKAIAVLLGKVEIPVDPEAPEQTEEEKSEEAGKERALLETCYVNRALCQLELGNYRATTQDCALALKINPANVKAYYRSASALFKVNKIEESEDACDRGLKIDPSNSALKKLREQIAAKVDADTKLQAKKAKEAAAIKKRQFLLSAALKARNITMKGSEKPPDLEDATVHLHPDPDSPESSLVFPAILLYPMHAQSDFIKEFGELDTLADHLSYIFPLPWDEEGLYKLSGVECYMDTTSGGMIKAGKKLSLLKLLSSGKTEIVDGLVRIHVVPTSLAPKWIEQMKARKKG